MSQLPNDPYGDDGWHTDDACTAIGLSVLESFAAGATVVMVTKHDGGGWCVVDDTTDDEEAAP